MNKVILFILTLPLILAYNSGCQPTPLLIRTRLVIQNTPNHRVSPTDIKNELKIAEAIFKPAGLKFSVQEIEIINYRSLSFLYYMEAGRHPNCLSIYFVDAIDLKNYKGQAMLPLFHGVIVTSRRSGTTLSHEIGHWGGLLHTFELDFVEDTPLEPKCRFKGDHNCGNIMNYCEHGRLFITKGQTQRLKEIVKISRKKCLMKEEKEDLLELIVNEKRTFQSYIEN